MADSTADTTQDYGYPRELKAVAQLGAILAGEGGRLDGTTVRTIVQKDPANLLSQTFYYRTNQGNLSDRLNTVPQAAGGIMPQVNPFLGAPNATFLYGYLPPDTTHPQLDLIQGPPVANYSPTYQSPDSAINPRTSGSEPTAGSLTSSVTATQYPTIPSAKGTLFSSAQTSLPTYNIWQISNLSDSDARKVTYRRYVGPVFGSGYTGVTMRQDMPGDGQARILVAAQNGVAELTRSFPIAQDLAYLDDSFLYYPPVSSSLTVPPRQILARGGANTGFQLHFYHSDASAMASPNQGRTIPSISVRWGDTTLAAGGTEIHNYDLQLIPGTAPILNFYHPLNHVWNSFGLKGPAFGSGGAFSIYVHYCGPNLLIGFGDDTTQWNCITPFDMDGDQDYQLLLYPRSPADAEISLVFNYITASFTYGPIAFNNYHPQAIQSTDDITNHKDLGFYNVNFTVPDRLADLLDEDTINNDFQSQRYSATTATLSTDSTASTGASAGLPDSQDSTPTFCGDCRRDGPPPSPELSFVETSTSDATQEDFTVYGQIIWNTTIEGPLFHHISNSTFSNSGQVERTPLIQTLPWGDLSSYLMGWNVSYRLEGDNRSILRGTATVRIANLAMSALGRQIWAALRKHRLAMTLGGGFDDTPSFFQGIITRMKTTLSATGSVTTLTLEDISTGLLSRIPFITSMAFPSMKYGRIIECSLGMSGLYDWYSLPDSPALTNALNQRLGYSPFESSLARQVLIATPRKKIMDIIKPVLGMVIDTNALPIFYWDSETDGGTLRLEWRSDPERQDALTCWGEITGDGIRLNPNASPSREHGVLKSDITIDTNTDQIHSGIVLYGQDYDSRIQVYTQKFPESYSADNLALLTASVGDSAEDNSVPYTGFRNTLVDEESQTMLPDKLSLNIYGDKIVPLIRMAYETIEFECYVTKPLSVTGTFKVQTILPTSQSVDTDYYLYRTVEYTLDVDQNTIMASVVGEMFPSVILPNA